MLLTMNKELSNLPESHIFIIEDVHDIGSPKSIIRREISIVDTNNKLYLVIFPLALIILFSPSMVAYGISSTPQYFTKDSSPYGTPYANRF